MGIGFSIRGDARNLDPIARSIKEQCAKALSAAIRSAAMQTRNRIITLLRFNQSRYATGHLVRSVATEIYAKGGNVTYAAVGTPVEYSKYLEDGTQDHLVPKSGMMPKGRVLAWRMQTGNLSGKKWFGKTMSKAASSGKWGGWAFSKGHKVSGIKAWHVFSNTREWLSRALPSIIDTEARKIK